MKLNATERQSANNDKDIANILNTYFASVFTHNSDIQHSGQQFTETDFVLDDITLIVDEVARVTSSAELKHLDNNKAHGPDGIPATLLTETAFQIAPSLCSLFSKSLRSGTIPDDWNIVPVHKRGEKSHVENYRPISLLSLSPKNVAYSTTSNIMYTSK